MAVAKVLSVVVSSTRSPIPAPGLLESSSTSATVVLSHQPASRSATRCLCGSVVLMSAWGVDNIDALPGLHASQLLLRFSIPAFCSAGPRNRGSTCSARVAGNAHADLATRSSAATLWRCGRIRSWPRSAGVHGSAQHTGFFVHGQDQSATQRRVRNLLGNRSPKHRRIRLSAARLMAKETSLLGAS